MQTSPELKITDQFGIQRILPLDKPVFTIGRNTESDLYLLTPSVSRQHAEIVFEDGGYYLVDKGSKSGSYINDQRIDRTLLRHLDRIQFGGESDVQIQFVNGPSAPALRPPGERATLDMPIADLHATSASDELQKLARFLEVNQAFKSSFAPEDVLRLIVDAAIEMTAAERGFLMLKNEAGELEFKVARDRARNSLPGAKFAMSRSVVNRAMMTNRSVIVNDSGDAGDSGAAGESAVGLDLRSIVCIPLARFKMREQMGATSILKPDVTGLLYVDSRLVTGALSKTSLTLLESLAFEASKCLESVRLMREEKEKEKLEHELAMAHEVQSALLPMMFRQLDCCEVAARSVPCRQVGGDFYDVIALDDGRTAFVLGDVSGKGISAALLAAMAQGGTQAQFSTGLSIAEVITNLNRLIVKRSAANRFITLFCGILDREGNFSYVNAGHNPPILARRDGRLELLSTKSLVLGAFDFAEYETRLTKVEAGDAIVMFSDGVTEAVNASNEMFGDERLERLVRKRAALSAEQIRDRILEEVLAFTHGLPQGDDITLLAIKVKV